MYRYPKIITLKLFFCIGLISILQAQPDPGINYQAVYRDDNGNPLRNEPISVDIRIRRNAANGAVVYRETHNLTTNLYGLFNLVIGTGDQVSTANFDNIDWGANPHFMDVRVNGLLLGRDNLEAVPYSYVATKMNLEQLQNVEESQPTEGQVLKWDGSNWVASDEGSANDLWQTDDADIFYQAGNVGVGILTNRDIESRLHIRHSNTDLTADPVGVIDGLILQNAGSGLNKWTLHAGHQTGGSEFHRNLIFAFRDNVVAKINPSGLYAQVSDARRKQNIQDLAPVLEKVMDLSPKSYQMVEMGDKLQLGFLAQEVGELFPDVVEYMEGQDLYMMSYEGFHPIAIKAIQEQQQQIVSLQDRILALERTLERLESKVIELEK